MFAVVPRIAMLVLDTFERQTSIYLEMWVNCDNIKGQQDFEDPPGRGEPKDNPNDIQASPTLHSGQDLWEVELKRLYALGAAREVQWLKVLLLKVRKMLFKPIYSPSYRCKAP